MHRVGLAFQYAGLTFAFLFALGTLVSMAEISWSALLVIGVFASLIFGFFYGIGSMILILDRIEAHSAMTASKLIELTKRRRE